MSEMNLAQFLPIAIALFAVVAAVLAGMQVLALNRRTQVMRSQFEQRLLQLEKQVKLTTQGAAGLGQRILALESQLQQLQKQTDSVDASDGAVAYTQAMQLFEQGVDTDTIATSCGLSNAEASLMAMLYQQKNRAA